MTYQRKEVIGAATLYLADCRSVLPTLNGIDAIVSDPPYGMDWNPDSRRFFATNPDPKKRRTGAGKNHSRIKGDKRPFDPKHLLGYRNVVLWGANHYAARLPKGTTLVWAKKHEHLFGKFLSDCEIGWRKGGEGAYIHVSSFPAPRRAFELGRKDGTCPHPTQKPESLMRWCIEREKLKPGAVICDPYMGTGTTAVAALALGHPFIGMEMDEGYFDIACDRIAKAQQQASLFAGEAA